jgi:hypothetical protein
MVRPSWVAPGEENGRVLGDDANDIAVTVLVGSRWETPPLHVRPPRRCPYLSAPSRLICRPSPTTFGLRKDQADEPQRRAADTLGKPIPPLDVEVATQ